jgi:hypothetical protein
LHNSNIHLVRMGCNEAVYIAAVLSVLEFISVLRHEDETSWNSYLRDARFVDFRTHIYVVFYFLSICSTILYVEGLKSPKFNPVLEPYIPFLYIYDSLAAVGLGYSLYYEDRQMMVISMIVLTNFFLLHILHTIFSKKGGSLVSLRCF